jgi:hypothetical protein
MSEKLVLGTAAIYNTLLKKIEDAGLKCIDQSSSLEIDENEYENPEDAGIAAANKLYDKWMQVVNEFKDEFDNGDYFAEYSKDTIDKLTEEGGGSGELIIKQFKIGAEGLKCDCSKFEADIKLTKQYIEFVEECIEDDNLDDFSKYLYRATLKTLNCYVDFLEYVLEKVEKAVFTNSDFFYELEK